MLSIGLGGCSMLSSQTEAETEQAQQAETQQQQPGLFDQSATLNSEFAGQTSSANEFTETRNQVRNLLNILWGQISGDNDLTKQTLTVTPEQANSFNFGVIRVTIGGENAANTDLAELDIFAQTLMARVDAQQHGQVTPTELWLGAGTEGLTTEYGIITRLSGIRLTKFENWHIVDNRPRLQALQCFAVQAMNNNRMLCPQQTQVQTIQRTQSPYHTPYEPHIVDHLSTYTSQMQIAADSHSFLLMSGDTVTIRAVVETLTDSKNTQYQNEFWVVTQSANDKIPPGTIVKTKQFISPNIGYFETDLVTPYQNTVVEKPQVFFDVTATLQANPDTVFDKAPEFTEVRVKTDSAQAEQKIWAAIFQSELRLQQLLNFIPATEEGAWASDLLRLHSSKLDAEFAGKRAAMETQLKLLQQTYRADGETELAEQAQTLLEQFQSWPLRATYLHGFDPVHATRDLAHNPLLNLHDMQKSESNPAENFYAISLIDPSRDPQPRQLGLTAEQHTSRLVYVINANGNISRTPSQEQEQSSKPEQRALAEQPYALVLRTIDDNDLPKGFKDVNVRLAQFLQHWDYSAAENSATENTAAANTATGAAQ